MNTRPVVMFFSGKGDNMLNIIERIKTVPDIMITYDREEGDDFNKDLLGLMDFISIPSNPKEEDYYKILSKYEKPIVTFHEWDKELPHSMCEEYDCFESNPLLVDYYPEDAEQLEIDPGKNEWIGSVIQQATPIKYRGGVLFSCRAKRESDYKNKIFDTSVEVWEDFFKDSNLKELLGKGVKKWVTSRWELGSTDREKYNIPRQ